MIEGGGSRQYIDTKTLMYREPAVWQRLLDKLARFCSSSRASRSRPAPTSSRSSTAGPER